jgi:hypothetical protein
MCASLIEANEAIYLCIALTTSKILAWVPVGIFFTRHVYSFASVTGTSMQVGQVSLLGTGGNTMLPSYCIAQPRTPVLTYFCNYHTASVRPYHWPHLPTYPPSLIRRLFHGLLKRQRSISFFSSTPFCPFSCATNPSEAKKLNLSPHSTPTSPHHHYTTTSSSSNDGPSP